MTAEQHFAARRGRGSQWRLVTLALCGLACALFLGVGSVAADNRYALSAASFQFPAAQIGTMFSEPTAVAVIYADDFTVNVPGVPVTFSVPTSGASGTFGGPNGPTSVTVMSAANGLATAPNLYANNIVGTYTMTITAEDSLPQAYGYTNTADDASKANVLSVGDGSLQSTQVGTAFTVPLSAAVFNGRNQPVAGVTVTFTAPATGASGTFATTGTNTATAVTGATGLAISPVITANNIASATGARYNVTVSVSGSDTATGDPLINAFALKNTPDAATGVPDSLLIKQGQNLQAAINTPFNQTFMVSVYDGNLRPLVGAKVYFNAPSGGPSGTFPTGENQLPGGGGFRTYVATTDANGRATALAFTANELPGNYSVSVRAEKEGVSILGSIGLTNGRAITTATLGVSPTNGIAYGAPLDLTANILARPSYLRLGGTIAFKNNGVAIPECASATVVNNVATCRISRPLPGAYNLTADYAGSAYSFSSKTPAVAYTVNRGATTISSITRYSNQAASNTETNGWFVTFDNVVSNLTAANFAPVTTGTLSGATISELYPIGDDNASTRWYVAIKTTSGEGSLGIDLVNDTGTTNIFTNLPFRGEQYLIDRTAPTVTIKPAADQADPAGSGPIRFTAVFSEPVNGLIDAGIALSGTAGPRTATVTQIAPNNGTTYSVAVSGMVRSGTVSATVRYFTTLDAANNGNAASTNADNTVTYNAPLTVTINQATGQADPTSAAPIRFTVVFSEPESGFTASDIALGDSTAPGTLTATISGTNPTYTVEVRGMTGPGTVVASIPAGVAVSSVGRSNAASTSTDNSVTFDNDPPKLVFQGATASPQGVVSSVTIAFVGTSSGTRETVNGFDTADLVLTRDGTPVSLSGATITVGADALGTVYTLGNLGGLNGADGRYTLALANGATVTDQAGQAAVADTPYTWTVDVTGPTLTIEQAQGQADPTNAGPIRFTATFSEPIAALAANTISFVGSTAPGALTATISGGGNTYTIAVAGMTGPGTVVVSLPAGSAVDSAGNANAASTSRDNSVTFAPDVPANPSPNPGPTAPSPGPTNPSPGPTAPSPTPAARPQVRASVVGNGTVSPEGTTSYDRGSVASYTATPDAGQVFAGWILDGQPAGYANPLTFTVDADRTLVARFAAPPSFGDVPRGTSQGEAIAELAARGIIKGYDNGSFYPEDPLQRAQLAALIVRAMGWDTGQPVATPPFSDIGGQDAEFRRAIAILAARGITKGYGDGTFNPTGEVTHAQAISLITRSMVQAGYWTPVTAAEDDGSVYPNVPAISDHRLDLLTYVKYAGAIPDRPANQTWADWQGPSSRGWTAQVLWQALKSYIQSGRMP